MRKGAFILLAVVVVIFTALIFFFQDRYLERAIETAGEAIVGAKVEVDSFDFSFIELKCSWDRLQIANPNNTWRNLIETGHASFAIEGRPLFWGRIIINEMVLEEVRSGSKRSTDGSLPGLSDEETEQGLAKQASKALEKQIRELSELDFSAVAKTMKIDSLVEPSRLGSVQGYNNLQQHMDSTFGFWQTQFEPQNYDSRIKELQSEIASFKPDSAKKDVLAMAEMLKKLDSVRKRVVELKTAIDAKQKALRGSVAFLQNDLMQVQNSLQADIEMAKRRAKLQGLEVQDVAMVLFGEPVVARIEQILRYIAIGRKYWPAVEVLIASNEPQSPPRFEGQNIYFPFHYRYPGLLIRRIRLSGMTAAGDTSRGYALEGEMFGLTNEPPVYGQSSRIDLKFFREAGNHYAVRGAFDHIGDTAKDSLWISADNIPVGSLQLTENKYFPASLHAERGGVDLTGYFAGDAIHINLRLRASPTTFQYASNTPDKVGGIIRDILDTITQIDLNVLVAGQEGDYTLSMRSNIDNELSAGVMGMLAGNLRAAQKQIENQVRAAVAGRHSESESRIARFQQTRLAEVENLQKRVQAEFDSVEKYKKDLETRIDAEKKKAEKIIADEKTKLQEKAKKGLKSLLKKKKN